MNISILLALSALQAPAVPVDLSSGWDTSGDVRVEQYLGRPALRFRSGRAIRRDITLRDGTIDVLVAASGRRSFAYLQFRMQEDQEHEEVYLRPHKSELPDALQYTTVIRGESHWQFHHGPGGTTAVELPRDRWIPLRIVLSGQRAAIFVGDTVRPDLVVPRLARETADGYLALRGFLPAGGAPAGEYPIAFAELVVRPGYVPWPFDSLPAERTAPPGAITRWSVSPSFVPAAEPQLAVPSARAGWSDISADPDGIVMLYRHRGRARAGQRTAVHAAAIIQSPAAQVRRLDLGFSDDVTVFLNGQPLFRGDASYRQEIDRQDGVIHASQASLFLPLRAGNNELVLLVSDVFGGWGFIARLAETPGATAAPR